MKAYYVKTKREVKKGDRLMDFRGDIHIFEGVTRGPMPGKSAKVMTDQGEFYASVFDLRVRK